jgi:hypothetical protein
MRLSLGSSMLVQGSVQLTNSKRYLIRAAKIQLLIADAINHPSMIQEKVEAMNRASCYFEGLADADELKGEMSRDIYTALLKICPRLCKMLTKSLHDKYEPLKITAIKLFEFLSETLGCSIGNFVPQILKSILETYPGHSRAL